MRYYTLTTGFLLLSLLLLGFTQPLEAQVWTDAMGRQVSLPAEPRRIVSLAPAVTELLFALGLEEQIVGVTETCDYPDAAQSKPRVGQYGDISLEAITLQQPDLVILSAASGNQSILSNLERLGLRVFVVYPRSLEETIATMRLVGDLTGRSEQGEQLATGLERTLSQVRAAVKNLPRPGLLYCVMIEPFIVAGPKTMVGDLIEAAGGKNLVPTGPIRYPTWNKEALLLADPEVILVSPNHGMTDPARLLDAWPELKAVRNQRVISINPDWVFRPGPRLSLGLLSLTEAIHNIQLQPEPQP